MKPGYKQTEVGVMPKDWHFDFLGNISVTSSGTTPSRSLNERYFRGGWLHWVKTTDLTNSDIYDTEEYVTEHALKETSLRIYPIGTVLVAMYGGFNQIGRTGILRVPSAVNQAITAIQPKDNVLIPDYLICVLNYRIDYWKRVAGSSRKDPNITSKDIRGYPIAYPGIEEQRAITASLSDVDALIASLDRLIAKKRDIKQAAMQQLLTGKTRLPGFSWVGGVKPGYRQTEAGVIPEEWEVVQIRDVGSVRTGPFGSALHESDYVQDGTPIITVEHLSEFGVTYSNVPMVSDADRRRLSAFELQENDIVFSRVGSIDRNALIKPIEAGWLFSGRLLRVRPNPSKVIASYLSYHFHSEPFKNRVQSVAVGQTMASLNTRILSDLYVAIAPLPEQHAIAAVLSDMDAEIAALEARRDKTRLLKQGMMQELLTGKTRLV